MFTFKRLRDRLYQLQFDDQFEMCMTFLRYQEFYESPRYEGRKFTLAEYMSWYAKAQSKDGTFSYPRDWGGFNVPVDVIKKVRALGIDDPNHYDALMSYVYTVASSQCDDAYLIGITRGTELDKHETTHAMWHIDEVYRDECHCILQETNPSLIDALKDVLIEMGYTEVTALDEVQAYLTTGDRVFKDVKGTLPGYKTLQRRLKEAHSRYYPDFTKDIK
jgi:hypothetical protein